LSEPCFNAEFPVGGKVKPEPETQTLAMKGAEWTPAMNGLAPECEEDKKRLCADVKPGGGRTHQCILDKKEELSEGCRRAEFTEVTEAVYSSHKLRRRV
jgi:hypothetical protein